MMPVARGPLVVPVGTGRHAAPTHKGARKAAVIGITQGRGNIRYPHTGPLEKTASPVEAHGLDQFAKGVPILIEAPLQTAHRHAEDLGNFVNRWTARSR